MSRLLLALLCLVSLLGCNRQATPPTEPANSRIKINTPGVNVDVKDKGSVDVNVPGTDVKVNPK